jgi:6-phosphogluconolactonase (cycloisomerase 2 family)
VSDGLQFINSYTGLAPGTAAGGLAITQPPSGTGEFLYVANQEAGSISIYIVSPSNGLLSGPMQATQASLGGPTSITIDSTGSFLYVTNQNSNTITQFTISSNSGALTNPVSVNTGNLPQFSAIP